MSKQGWKPSPRCRHAENHVGWRKSRHFHAAKMVKPRPCRLQAGFPAATGSPHVHDNRLPPLPFRRPRRGRPGCGTTPGMTATGRSCRRMRLPSGPRRASIFASGHSNPAASSPRRTTAFWDFPPSKATRSTSSTSPPRRAAPALPPPCSRPPRRSLARHGIRDAVIQCSAGNDRAHRFYARAGWRDSGVRQAPIWTPDGRHETHPTHIFVKQLSSLD